MVWSGYAVLVSGKTDSIKLNNISDCLLGSTFVYSEVFNLDLFFSFSLGLLINRIGCIAVFALRLTLFLFCVALFTCYQIRFEERVSNSVVTTQDAVIYSSLIPAPVNPGME
ncbi:hypothetical protein Tco_0556472 [Tanacetum coccineum]